MRTPVNYVVDQKTWDMVQSFIEESGKQFSVYRDIHAAKGTPSSNDKAVVNAEWAKRAEDLLERVDGIKPS